ncbi:serine dehydratase [Massilia sp. WF1]|uniref:L-serine ammonia-lyase n=1 Tax=unclassified Massilia TaxID=2609279 RepID=UPI00064B3114|nr:MULTISPECIES: L-serine ammonia-lyase [unclassified Massilia]ALK97235.1 serine dehydratase [Massilia sp. WG5]KLU36417.1 serine dehydratase [Massilia sp. WF1]
MDMSVFDLFKIGIGPSSSHTVGPMVAARRFLQDYVQEAGSLMDVAGVEAHLYGSLALTGVGHATDKAVILGLMGETPQDVDPDSVEDKLAEAELDGVLKLLGAREVPFSQKANLVWHKQSTLPEHPNGMRFVLKLRDGSLIERVYYSIGGGFITAAGESQANLQAPKESASAPIPYPFDTMRELLEHGKRDGMSIPAMLRANELARMSEQELDAGLDRIWQVMRDCIAHGMVTEGQLPGGLNVKRRAAKLWRQEQEARCATNHLPHDAVNQVSLYAMAVNEENAAGGRVVTAPTNGAAGIIPAVLRYYAEDCRPTNAQRGIREFLLTSAAIGMLCKKNASISGAEIGCQGEVGVACAMAAAGLVAALGGSNEQIENAAEIGIEHHLGMTCDPIGGLVQIPCIERNGMGAIKAITATSLALKGDGTHFVSLDEVIETMRQTGYDMQAKYKETSLGGLAIHVVTVNHAAC